MKKLGILGGMSVESTLIYYQQINKKINQRLTEQGFGNDHSAKIVIDSVDFAEVIAFQKTGNWQAAGDYLAQHAKQLEQAGVDGILLATNTMHKVAPIITQKLTVPFLDLIELTAQALHISGVKKVGLLGTKFTMSDGFYQEILANYAIEVLTPLPEEQILIHQIIFDELCQGKILPHSKVIYQTSIESLANKGAEAVILGCTEIGLLIEQADVSLPVFDTTRIHIDKAVEWMLMA